MPVVVSREALADLESIRAYLNARSPVAAVALTQRLADAMVSLEEMPMRGRPGLVDGTRELVNVAPFVVTYRVTQERVEIVRVWHKAQERS